MEPKKPIIINGVDISECKRIAYKNSLKPMCGDTITRCSGRKNCYYKQLKRKEQECKELKKHVFGLRPELKSMIDETCCKYNIEAKTYHEKIIEIINNLDKYEQTLTKIKDICLHEVKELTDSAIYGGRYVEISQIIDEVEDE